MKPHHWMPFYIGDYLRDTMGLGRAEHGSYVLLIFAYWANGGPLLDDDESLREIAKCPPHEWQRTRGLMLRFFVVANGHWVHKRVDKELREAFESHTSACDRTRKARETRKAMSVTDTVTTTVTDTDNGVVTGVQPQPQPQPPLQPQSEPPLGREPSAHAPRFQKPNRADVLMQCQKIGLPDIEADKFINHFESNGWRVGGKSQMKSWQHAIQNWKIRWDEKRVLKRPGKIAV